MTWKGLKKSDVESSGTNASERSTGRELRRTGINPHNSHINEKTRFESFKF